MKSIILGYKLFFFCATGNECAFAPCWADLFGIDELHKRTSGFVLTVNESKIFPEDVLASSSESSVAKRRRSHCVSAVLCWNMNCSIALRAPSGVLPAPLVSSCRISCSNFLY